MNPLQPEPWKTELSGRLKNAQDFSQTFNLAPETLSSLEQRLAFSLTPYYAALCKKEPALLKTVLPSPEELITQDFELSDPMVEDAQSPTRCLVHRYPNRVLFLLTPHCPVYCRYCTRSRKVGKAKEKLGQADWQEALEWIKTHPEIEEVILSGGEPLSLSDHKIEWILTALKKIPHIKFLRFSTKTVAVMPQRITEKLAAILSAHSPLLLNLHFIHPAEITKEVEVALNKLNQTQVMLSSQTVLLKGVNDDPAILADLYRKLFALGVQPYGLYLCDWIKGADHFRVGPTKAMELMGQLRTRLSGPMIPKLIADPPGGKVDVGQTVRQGPKGLELRNWKGEYIHWPE